MRNTIKNHNDFFMTDDDPIAKSPYFIVRAKLAKFPDDARYGVTATKRTFRLAIHRNRAKRMLRDWIAHNEKYLLPKFDYVFIARSAILDASRADGRDSMRRALYYIMRTNSDKNEKK